LGRSVLVLVQGRLARSLLVLPDPPLGLVDATIIAVTEMLSEGKVAALDHRHFSVVRSAHTAALTLLP
jgi:predicted nucleic acid-binding protein